MRFLVRSSAEGLRLIEHPEIVDNFNKALRWRPKNALAVLVPCAGTKPFPEAPSHKQGYLAALEGKKADLWVVSEPLGVVPYEWSRRPPNESYDFPPRFLRGEAWDALVERVAEWLEKVAPKYKKVFVALPGHHERLLRAALELHNPGNLRDSTHSQCLSSKACPSGHGRATSKKYRRYLAEVVRNPHMNSDADYYKAATGAIERYLAPLAAGGRPHPRDVAYFPQEAMDPYDAAVKGYVVGLRRALVSVAKATTKPTGGKVSRSQAGAKRAEIMRRTASNPDADLQALEQRLSAGDLTAIPALISELRLAGRTAPWDGLVLWRGVLTGTGEGGLLAAGQTAEAIAVIEPRKNKAGWGDPIVGVWMPVTGPRGPGWAPAWFGTTGTPDWVVSLMQAPRLIPRPKRRNSSDADLRELERRWLLTGSNADHMAWLSALSRVTALTPADLAVWRAALNRAGQAPPGELFYRDLARRAGRFMASAAVLLERAAAHVRTQAFNAADIIERQCLSYAIASRSAAARLSRSNPQSVSTPHFRRWDASTGDRGYWEDLMADASHDVAGAETLLRDIADDMRRNGDQVGAARVGGAVRWVVDLREAISNTRDPHNGHSGRGWWDRHGPRGDMSVDRWWRLRGQSIPSLTEDAPPATRRNPDEDLRELRRAYAATSDPAVLKRLYVATERAGDHLHPDEEFEAVELMCDDRDLLEGEVSRRHEERVNAGRLTRRERRLLKELGERLNFAPLLHPPALGDTYHDERNALEGPDGPIRAMRVARLMRKVELGGDSADCMNEIAMILGADRGIDTFDDPRPESDGPPLYVYAAWMDFARPTLFWRSGQGPGAAGPGFLIRTTTETAAVVARLGRQ